MVDLPPDELEQAEAAQPAPDHPHGGITAEDGTLAEHLGTAHALDVEDDLSPATQEGLHDRMHHESKAADN